MMGNYYGYYGLGLMGGGLMMLLFWGAIIWLIIWLVKESAAKNKPDNQTMPLSSVSAKALDILKERYAKGEINKSEFEEKKKDLLD
ncbi:MAG: SHOCT domain-containing protein [Patescibacteria group bacterium]|jgi:putative membrane protein